MRFAASLMAAGLAAFATLPAAAQENEPIGAAVRVINLVTAEINRATRTLAKDDGVHQNELIAVSNDGIGEIVLADETKLALGPGAKLTLDKFVYDPDKTGGAIVLNMTRGAFRFVTGVARKPSYVIRTPTASITVRGTIFDVYVEQSGAIWMLLHEGEVQVCNDRGECRVLDDPCKLVRVDGNGGVGKAGDWNGLRADEDVNFETAFPFVVTPPTIDPEERFERTAVERGTCGQDEKTQKTRRADDGPTKSTKVKKAEPKPEPKKVTKVAPKIKVVKKTDEDDKPKKKTKDKGDSGAKAAKALGIAIGIGLAIGAAKGGGKRSGGSHGY
jgi:hypothetical protein